jgi:tRNA(fMet)-specific endonuclease VapC
MDYIVLDTDICSFLLKHDTRGEQYRSYLQDKTPCLSFQTVAELYQWAESNGWGEKRRTQLDQWLRKFVILPYDDETARIWAQIRVECRQKGAQLSPQDAWIASSALRYKCPLITHNVGDYQCITNLVTISEQDECNSSC